MHKSALTFGLLASSLVMLMIMPFLNNNNSFGSEDGNGVGTEQCGEEIEDAFQQFLIPNQFEQLSEALDSPTGVKVDVLGSEVTLRSFEDICSALEPFTSSLTKFDKGLLDILGDILNPPLNINSALLSCVYKAINS